MYTAYVPHAINCIINSQHKQIAGFLFACFTNHEICSIMYSIKPMTKTKYVQTSAVTARTEILLGGSVFRSDGVTKVLTVLIDGPNIKHPLLE